MDTENIEKEVATAAIAIASYLNFESIMNCNTVRMFLPSGDCVVFFVAGKRTRAIGGLNKDLKDFVAWPHPKLEAVFNQKRPTEKLAKDVIRRVIIPLEELRKKSETTKKILLKEHNQQIAKLNQIKNMIPECEFHIEQLDVTSNRTYFRASGGCLADIKLKGDATSEQARITIENCSTPILKKFIDALDADLKETSTIK